MTTIHDSVKEYFEGVHKVRPPRETCEVALAALRASPVPILERCARIPMPSGIPALRALGTATYRREVGTIGSGGKGHSELLAVTSGLMEMLERISCYRHINHGRRARRTSLAAMPGNAYTFADLFSVIPAGSSACDLDEERLAATEMLFYEASMLDGTPVFIPERFMEVMVCGSNGMAAGNTLEEALLHGVLEVIERTCLTRIRRERITTPEIDKQTVDSDIAQSLIARFRGLGQELRLRDFSLGTGIPVVGVARRVDEDRTELTAGAATTREEALIRALAENSQTEGGMQCFVRSQTEHHFAEAEMVDFASIVDIDDRNIKCEIENVARMLGERGMRIIFVDTTDDDLGIPAVISHVTGAKFEDTNFRNYTASLALVHELLEDGRYNEARRWVDEIEPGAGLNRSYFEFFRASIEEAAGDETGAAARFAVAAESVDEGLPRRAAGMLRCASRTREGICLLARGDVDGAIANFVAVFALNPHYSIDYVARRFNDRPELFAQALALFEEVRAVRLAAPDAAPEELCRLYHQYQGVKAELAACLERSERAFEAGNHERAATAAREAIAVDEFGARLMNARWLLGRALAKGGDLSAAVTELKAAEQVTPTDARINRELAFCYGRLGDAEGFADQMAELLRKDPLRIVERPGAAT